MHICVPSLSQAWQWTTVAFTHKPGYLVDLLLLHWFVFPHSDAQCDLQQDVFNTWLNTTYWLCFFCSLWCNAESNKVAGEHTPMQCRFLGDVCLWKRRNLCSWFVDNCMLLALKSDSSQQEKNKTRHWNKWGECNTFNFILLRYWPPLLIFPLVIWRFIRGSGGKRLIGG